MTDRSGAQPLRPGRLRGAKPVSIGFFRISRPSAPSQPARSTVVCQKVVCSTKVKAGRGGRCSDSHVHRRASSFTSPPRT
eukprot:2071562-Prymnesium_polylepis.1